MRNWKKLYKTYNIRYDKTKAKFGDMAPKLNILDFKATYINLELDRKDRKVKNITQDIVRYQQYEYSKKVAMNVQQAIKENYDVTLNIRDIRRGRYSENFDLIGSFWNNVRNKQFSLRSQGYSGKEIDAYIGMFYFGSE